MLQETKASLPRKVKTQMSFPKASFFFFFPKALLKPRESKPTHNETPNKVTETDKFTEGPSHSNVQEGKPKAVLTSGLPGLRNMEDCPHPIWLGWEKLKYSAWEPWQSLMGFSIFLNTFPIFSLDMGLPLVLSGPSMLP